MLQRATSTTFPLPQKMSENADPNVKVVKKQLQGYVGFANLPNQVHRKSIKKGFNFTVMVVGTCYFTLLTLIIVVGESGLGKSTLVNTLFNSAIYPEKQPQELSNETPKTIAIQALTSELEENGVRLKLTVIDTPGFGDYLNNDMCWQPILENLDQRFESFLEQENRVNRKKIVDNRVHACLYFIAPTGHSLKPVDVEFMKRLQHRVNLIPVIAKADTLTDDEMRVFKSRILENIKEHGIKIFLPSVGPNDDAETVAESKDLLSRMPFAVVGSMQDVMIDGRRVRARQYPWGIIEVDNDAHNDFVKLRQMLVRSHMEDLKDITNNGIYEHFRTQKLSNGGATVEPSGEVNPLLKFEEEKAAHEARIAKLETEMTQVFSVKVAEKEARMKQNEEELYQKHRESREQLERKRQELEEKKRRLEASLKQQSGTVPAAEKIEAKTKPKKTGLFGK
jgi:septin 7